MLLFPDAVSTVSVLPVVHKLFSVCAYVLSSKSSQTTEEGRHIGGGGTIADLAHDDTVDAVLILIFIAASSIFRSLNSCSSVNVSICLVLILF